MHLMLQLANLKVSSSDGSGKVDVEVKNVSAANATTIANSINSITQSNTGITVERINTTEIASGGDVNEKS